MAERATLSDLDGAPHAEVFAADPGTIRLTLAADERIAPHSHPDTEVLIHVLSGRLSVAIEDETYELGAGELLRFDGGREVAPTALEDSSALVVLAPS
jgi:quercetin dioxygenase-like cupin family protein